MINKKRTTRSSKSELKGTPSIEANPSSSPPISVLELEDDNNNKESNNTTTMARINEVSQLIVQELARIQICVVMRLHSVLGSTSHVSVQTQKKIHPYTSKHHWLFGVQLSCKTNV